MDLIATRHVKRRTLHTKEKTLEGSKVGVSQILHNSFGSCRSLGAWSRRIVGGDCYVLRSRRDRQAWLLRSSRLSQRCHFSIGLVSSSFRPSPISWHQHRALSSFIRSTSDRLTARSPAEGCACICLLWRVYPGLITQIGCTPSDESRKWIPSPFSVNCQVTTWS
jgi:hypothetical protein